jgi:hypothetical protein
VAQVPDAAGRVEDPVSAGIGSGGHADVDVVEQPVEPVEIVSGEIGGRSAAATRVVRVDPVKIDAARSSQSDRISRPRSRRTASVLG